MCTEEYTPTHTPLSSSSHTVAEGLGLPSVLLFSSALLCSLIEFAPRSLSPWSLNQKIISVVGWWLNIYPHPQSQRTIQIDQESGAKISFRDSVVASVPGRFCLLEVFCYKIRLGTEKKGGKQYFSLNEL